MVCHRLWVLRSYGDLWGFRLLPVLPDTGGVQGRCLGAWSGGPVLSVCCSRGQLGHSQHFSGELLFGYFTRLLNWVVHLFVIGFSGLLTYYGRKSFIRPRIHKCFGPIRDWSSHCLACTLQRAEVLHSDSARFAMFSSTDHAFGVRPRSSLPYRTQKIGKQCQITKRNRKKETRQVINWIKIFEFIS